MIPRKIWAPGPGKKQRKINKCEFLPKVLKSAQYRNQT
ncbi:hypothetical protein D082_10790 [Synechocystis sp. PCC 6714]|nr:hypothetical protein D082_10790 [Synechocystis sp. PCC 6714]